MERVDSGEDMRKGEVVMGGVYIGIRTEMRCHLCYLVLSRIRGVASLFYCSDNALPMYL